MLCQNCGAPLEDGAVTCSSCGARVERAEKIMFSPIENEVETNAQEKPVSNENSGKFSFYQQTSQSDTNETSRNQHGTNQGQFGVNQNQYGTNQNQQPAGMGYTASPYQKSAYITQEGPSRPLVPMDDSMGLKWAKFLGYFALWVSCIMNAKTALQVFKGSEYGILEDFIYALYPSIKTLNVVYAVLIVLVVIVGAYAAICIIQYKRLAITLVPLGNLLAGGISLIYIVLASNIIGSSNVVDGSTIAQIVIQLAMAYVNRIYFRNREMVFVN